MTDAGDLARLAISAVGAVSRECREPDEGGGELARLRDVQPHPAEGALGRDAERSVVPALGARPERGQQLA
jgi:hypothetical protein